MESDALWKAPTDLPTGLGKRGPYPVSHSYHSHDGDEGASCPFLQNLTHTTRIRAIPNRGVGVTHPGSREPGV